jgi:small subunit ribosomal protein S16
MLKIRLSRTGKKRQPSYRIVVADVNSKRDGRIVERIGYYNPLVDPIDYRIDEGRALHWLSVGAQPSDAVERLLVKQGTVERLGRLHAGESLEALVAEFTGEEIVAEAIEEAIVEEIVEEAIEEAIVEEIVEEAIEEAIVEEIVEEAIEEAVVEEAIEEAIAEEIVEEAIAEEIAEEIEEAEEEAVEDEEVE